MKKTIKNSTTFFLIILLFSTYSCKKDKALLPVLTTTVITANSFTSATSGGIITSDGGAAITARGVCWGTAADPTVALATKTTDGTGNRNIYQCNDFINCSNHLLCKGLCNE